MPTSVRRTAGYVLIADAVVSLVAIFTFPPGALAAEVFLAIFAVSALIILLKSFTKRYGFDHKGVYAKGKLMFAWSQVKRIELQFKEHKGSATLVSVPTWDVIPSGGPVQRVEYVSYGAGLSFILEDGQAIRIQSNLDQLTRRGVVEKIDEFAKAANPRIEFK